MNAMSSRFSIIVPVFNGEEMIATCLEALITQDYNPEKFEVIVVDDGSRDKTADIVSKYPVHLINLKSNKGRIHARNTGAQAARYECLMFNDYRVVPEKRLLAKINERNYQPVMPDVIDYDGSKWGFKRFFYLLRCRIYNPFYPFSSKFKEVMITPENFNKVPKGTTNFVCNKELWFRSQPENVDKYTNDDTRILRNIVQVKPILKTAQMSVKYCQRTQLKQIIKHTYERGPRFADYYLRPGSIYFIPYETAWLALMVFVLLILWEPKTSFFVFGLGLLLYLLTILYMKQNWRDFFVVGACFPVIFISFGLGIIKWQLQQIKDFILGEIKQNKSLK
jgi:glycosyltransferase involved in cell wall biosynthesis